MRRIHALPPRATQQPSAICSRFYRVTRRDRWTPLRLLEISFSQGAKWKALISTYIGTIPLSGEASATQRKSGDLPSRSVSNAMMANVGAATSDNQSAAPRAVVWPLPAQAASRSAAVITFVPGVDPDIGLLGFGSARVLVVATPPGACRVAPLGGAVEPLEHAPEAVQSAREGGIGVVDGAILARERAHARPIAKVRGHVGSAHGRVAATPLSRAALKCRFTPVIVFDAPFALLLLGERDVKIGVEVAAEG